MKLKCSRVPFGLRDHLLLPLKHSDKHSKHIVRANYLDSTCLIGGNKTKQNKNTGPFFRSQSIARALRSSSGDVGDAALFWPGGLGCFWYTICCFAG